METTPIHEDDDLKLAKERLAEAAELIFRLKTENEELCELVEALLDALAHSEQKILDLFNVGK